MSQQLEELTKTVREWAVQSTDAHSPRWHDLLRDKEKHVLDFFRFAEKPVTEVVAEDVERWLAKLGQRLEKPTVLTWLSHLRSFLTFLVAQGVLPQSPSEGVTVKLDHLPRPNRVTPFDREAALKLEQHLWQKALMGDISAKRDYAIMLFFLLTDLGRRAILELRWSDVVFDPYFDRLEVRYLYHGDAQTKVIDDSRAKNALTDYLEASGRLETMQPQSPLWTRHDRAGAPGEPLRSQSFSDSLKRYCEEAGVPPAKLQTIRDTYKQALE